MSETTYQLVDADAKSFSRVKATEIVDHYDVNQIKAQIAELEALLTEAEKVGIDIS